MPLSVEPNGCICKRTHGTIWYFPIHAACTRTVMACQSTDVVRFVNSRPVKIVDSNIAQGLARTTGWKTWGSALVAGKFLARIGLKGKTVLDLSSGNGVVALICAALDAKQVVATECKLCMKILEKNIEFNVLDKSKWLAPEKILVKELNWGSTILDNDLLTTTFDFIVLSDLVFIAVRDSIMDELLATIMRLARKTSQVVLIYEERILEGEEEFLDKLKVHFNTETIPLDKDLLSWLEDGDDHEGMGGLFYEEPAIIIMMCTLK